MAIKKASFEEIDKPKRYRLKKFMVAVKKRLKLRSPRLRLSRNGRRHKDCRVMEFNEPASTGLTEGNTDKNTEATQDSKAQKMHSPKTRMHKRYRGKTRNN